MPAPWTFDDLPDTGDPSFNEEARDAFSQWQSNFNEGMASKAEIDHTHGEGGTVLSLVANEAALGTGATDGELKICQDTYGNRYTWDDDNSKWRVGDGNKYATGDLPTTAYTIETGTLVFDVTVGAWMRWTGSAWIAEAAHRLVAKASVADSPYAVTADDLAGNTELTNTGSVGEMVFNLPAGFNNAKVKGRVTVAQAMTFNTNGSQKFRFRSTQGSAGGSISSDEPGSVAIIAWTGSDWGLELLGPWDYT